MDFRWLMIVFVGIRLKSNRWHRDNIVAGARWISVVANILPGQTHELVHQFLQGNIQRARELQLYLYNLIKALFIETNPIPAKTALGLMGLIDPYLRLPLYKMSDANRERLKTVLIQYELLKP